MAEKKTEKTATDILAEIALEERAEKIQAARDVKARLSEATERRKASEKVQFSTQLRVWQNCDHLQGNHRPGEMPFKEISHLSLHTYHDNVRRIRCNKCGFIWHPGDTAEFYFVWRDGKSTGEKRENPTGIGWKEAYKTVQRFSTIGNKPSRGFITVQTVVSDPDAVTA
jgi:hypothetical protein